MMKKQNKKLPISVVKNLFSNKNLYASYLFVEKELSLAQSDLNIIPKKSAKEISKKCNIKFFNLKILEQDIKKTKAPIASLVNFIVKLCSEDTKKYVHYGATTQNIIHSGLILLLRNSHIQAMFRMSQCLKTLSKLSKKFSNHAMVARTNGQHAMPITFGFKISEWSEIILRFEERFCEIEKRLFILIFGGAVGAMHSFKDKSEILYKNLSKRLNLNKTEVSSRAIMDNLAEYTILCGHLGSSLSNMGRELNFYMREEIQEISEYLSNDVIGSSTMPQKINPKYVYAFISLAKDMESYTLKGINMMDVQNEGDLAKHYYQIRTIKEIGPKLNILLEDFNNLLNILKINSKKMIENLEITKGLIHSENITMSIASSIGKQKAYKIIKSITDEVRSKNKNYQDLLLKNKTIREILSKKEIIKLMKFKNNVGSSKKIAKRVSKITNTRALKLESRIKKISQIIDL